MAGAGAALAGAAAYLAAVDPAAGGGYFVPCPLAAITGLSCPLCGVTRATHQLLNGNVAAAVRLNLFVIPIVVLIVVGWTRWATAQARHEPAPGVQLSPPLAAIVASGLVTYGVARNLW